MHIPPWICSPFCYLLMVPKWGEYKSPGVTPKRNHTWLICNFCKIRKAKKSNRVSKICPTKSTHSMWHFGCLHLCVCVCFILLLFFVFHEEILWIMFYQMAKTIFQKYFFNWIFLKSWKVENMLYAKCTNSTITSIALSRSINILIRIIINTH